MCPEGEAFPPKVGAVRSRGRKIRFAHNLRLKGDADKMVWQVCGPGHVGRWDRVCVRRNVLSARGYKQEAALVDQRTTPVGLTRFISLQASVTQPPQRTRVCSHLVKHGKDSPPLPAPEPPVLSARLCRLP